MKTNLSSALETSGNEVLYDNAAKSILANKIIVSRILKQCVEEFKDLDLEYIENNCLNDSIDVSTKAVHQDHPDKVTQLNSESSSIKEQTIYYDVKIRACIPQEKPINLIINFEIQKKDNPGYALVTRGIYYCSRMISEQYGTVFTKSNYQDINKVYSIWICPEPAKKRENNIQEYEIKESCVLGSQKADKKQYDLLRVIILYLTDKQSEKEIINLLNVLFSKENFEVKKEKLSKNFNIQMDETDPLGKEVSNMCNLSELLIEEGEARGIAKGRAEGRIESSRKILINMKKSGYSYEEMSKITDIPIEEIKELLTPVAV